MSTDIAAREPVEIEVTETAWTPQGAMPYEQWEDAGRHLQRMGRAWQWWVGDWILYGEANYGEMYDQAIDLTGMEYETLKNVVYVARHVDKSLRSDQLTWSHHKVVAALPPTSQALWLSKAESEHLTVSRLSSALAGDRDKADDEPLAPTHRATVTFLVAAADDDEAEATVKRLADLLTRKTAGVTHKQTVRLAR